MSPENLADTSFLQQLKAELMDTKISRPKAESKHMEQLVAY